MKNIIQLLTTITIFCAFNLQIFAENTDASAIRRTIADYVKQHDSTTAAMSIAVFTSQDIWLEKSYGYINIEENRANCPDAVFEWGSAGKLLVWVSAMQLAEQGKLDLNADIRNYLPDGFLRRLVFDEPITMMHLMNHTPGFQDLHLLTVKQGRRIRELGDVLKRFEPPQLYRPGEVVAYSNYGTALAGYIVELISGKPFYQYVHDHIFAPLNMTKTALNTDLSDNEWVKIQRTKINGYTRNLTSMGAARFLTPFYPAGQATGTISDFRKFAQALLPNENGASLLFQNPETLSQLFTPTAYFPDGKSARSYHGFLASSHLGGHVVGHAGNTKGMSAHLLIDLENEFGVVLLTNQGQESTYNYLMMPTIFGEADYSKFDNSANDVASIDGLYRMARNWKKGISKPLSLMIIPLFESNENLITKVAPGVYKFTGLGMMFLLFTSVDESGNLQYLGSFMTDVVKQNMGLIIFELLVFFLFIVSAFYGFVMLIIMLIKRLRKKEQILPCLRSGIYAASFVALINLFMFMISVALMSASLTGTIIHGILFWLLTLAIIFCIVKIISRAKTLDLLKKQKRQLIITSILGAMVVINVIYWQLWMFWI